MNGKYGRQIEGYKEVGERLLQWAKTGTEAIDALRSYMGTEWKLAQEIEGIEKRRDPSPYRAPAKWARYESPKDRNLKRLHSSGERLDARDRSKERGARDKSRDRSRKRSTRDRSRDKSRERGIRNKSREISLERGVREKSRERVTAHRPKSPPRTYATEATRTVYSRSSPSRRELSCAHTVSSVTWQAAHCVSTRMPTTTQRLNERTRR
jgi:hypothetical protein